MKNNLQKKLALLWKFLKGSKKFFFISMIFTTIAALVDMLIPQIVRFSIDAVIGGKPFRLPAFLTQWLAQLGGTDYLRAHFWIIAAAVVLAALLKIFSQYTACVCNARGTETLSKTTRDSLFLHITRLPYSWYGKNPTGDIIQRCTSDISTMNEFLSEELTAMFRVVVLLFLSLFFMLNMNIPLTLIALAAFPLTILNSILFDRKIERSFQKFDEGEGRLSSEVQENLTGVRVVRAFGQEARELKKLKQQNAAITEDGIQIGKAFGAFFCTSDILSGIQVMLVILFGACFCLRGTMTAGEYIAFVSYNTLLAWPLNELGRMITGLGKTNVSIDRIRYIMESPAEEGPEQACRPDLRQDIVFRHVSFSYNEKTPILKDVSFTMKAGTTLGILGGTGSGKTTMMLLGKIYPLSADGGEISIGGVDIRQIDTEYLRQNIGIVLQDAYLFSKTIAENIGISVSQPSMEAIREAADAACLTGAIDAFAKGFETPVGERGVTLSGGQKQRTTIARTLMQKVPILIFDDSLSAVDMQTDAKIRASLEKRFGSASMILISHRISTISKADHILVLNNGVIAEQAPMSSF